MVEASPSASPSLVEAGYVEIGDGRSLYRVCRGEGSPTVILDAGDGADHAQWDQVITQIAEVTKVCSYDRGGLGRSDPVTGCRHLADLTGDLDQLLEAADIPGPYVVVGTSGGGYIAAGFAEERPDDVVGIVLLDTFRPYTDPPPELIAETACDAPGNDERRDYLAVEHEAWDAPYRDRRHPGHGGHGRIREPGEPRRSGEHRGSAGLVRAEPSGEASGGAHRPRHRQR